MPREKPVLQRSTHDSAVDIPAIPTTVQPGEIVDWPNPIAGFEPVETPAETSPPAKFIKKRADPPAGEEPTP